MHGNYLAPSIIAAGLDPLNLPTRRGAATALPRIFLYLPHFFPCSDPSKMNFGGDAAKAWKDIW